MKYQRFSPRQTLTLTWWKRPEFADYDGILCDGSIRSGKTVSMAVGFILWSMYSFNNESFAICGRTIESLRRNVIVHLPSWLEGLFKVTERRAENKLITLTRQVTKAEFREIIYALSKKARLRLWNEPDKYYIAELYDPAEVQDYYLETGREFELNFIAEPFAYGPTITTPLENGRNKIAYQGTAETPCMIVLRNVSSSNVQNITITATKRSD